MPNADQQAKQWEAHAARASRTGCSGWWHKRHGNSYWIVGSDIVRSIDRLSSQDDVFNWHAAEFEHTLLRSCGFENLTCPFDKIAVDW